MFLKTFVCVSDRITLKLQHLLKITVIGGPMKTLKVITEGPVTRVISPGAAGVLVVLLEMTGSVKKSLILCG